MVRLLNDIKYSLTAFFRNKGAVFWTFIFPIILFVLLGYLLGGTSSPLTVYYNDNDHTQMSGAFINAMNTTNAVKMIDGSGMNLSEKLAKGEISCYIDIPNGYQNDLMAAETPGGNASGATVQIYYDKSQPTSLAIVSVVSTVADKINMLLSGTKDLVSVLPHDVTTNSVNYLDFLFPGIIGMSVMSIAVNGTVGQSARNQGHGRIP